MFICTSNTATEFQQNCLCKQGYCAIARLGSLFDLKIECNLVDSQKDTLAWKIPKHLSFPVQLLQSLVFLLYRNHIAQITSTPNRKDPEAAFVTMGVHVPLNVLGACPLV